MNLPNIARLLKRFAPLAAIIADEQQAIDQKISDCKSAIAATQGRLAEDIRRIRQRREAAQHTLAQLREQQAALEDEIRAAHHAANLADAGAEEALQRASRRDVHALEQEMKELEQQRVDLDA